MKQEIKKLQDDIELLDGKSVRVYCNIKSRGPAIYFRGTLKVSKPAGYPIFTVEDGCEGNFIRFNVADVKEFNGGAIGLITR